MYTVISFVSVSDKFDTCTVVSVNGTLGNAKMCTCNPPLNVFILSSTSLPLQVSNLALVETKRITVDIPLCLGFNSNSCKYAELIHIEYSC
jgi:hypothetical protein